MIDFLLVLFLAGHISVPVIGAYVMYYRHRRDDLRRRTILLSENLRIARGGRRR